MSKVVKVQVGTEEEFYPCLVINEAPEGPVEPGRSFDIPVELMDALNAALLSVEHAEAAIMTHIGERHPDASDIQDWLKSRRNDVILDSVRAKWEQAHPDGPGWYYMSWDERFTLLRDAGWRT